jgi:hypothetical protein
MLARGRGREQLASLGRWAVAYRRYSTAYVGQEDAARIGQRGIWGDVCKATGLAEDALGKAIPETRQTRLRFGFGGVRGHRLGVIKALLCRVLSLADSRHFAINLRQ